jgi:uridine phosphorylase
MLPYFDEEEMLKPSAIISERNNMPSTVIMMWSFSLFNTLKDSLKCTTLSTFKAGVRCPVYGFKYKGTEMACVLLPIGAPVAVGFIEEYFVRGVKNFVCIGTCGSLSPQTKGKLVVPTYAYRDEGTSWHYAPHDEPWIKVKTSLQLSAILDSLGVPYVCGRVWTNDAFYRETPSAVALMKEQECLAVEMECAANMAVAQYRGANCYQMLFPADLLEGSYWNSGSLGKRSRSVNDKLAKIALDVASLVQL